METFAAAVAVVGLFCFPITMILRGFRDARRFAACSLLVATLVSLTWGFLDSRPSSNIRYGAFGYAAVLGFSGYLYLTRRPSNAVTKPGYGRALSAFMMENSRHIIIGAALVLSGLIYAASHRYQVVADESRGRILILDRWTGTTTTKY